MGVSLFLNSAFSETLLCVTQDGEADVNACQDDLFYLLN